MKKLFPKGLIPIFLLFLSGIGAGAQPGPPDDDDVMMMPMHGRGAGMMMEKLNLTDDQQKQFGKLHDEMEKKQIDLRAKVKSLRVDLKGLFRDDKPDQKKIESKINEISKLQTEMKLAHVGFWFAVNKILTAEQQKVWKQHPILMGKGHGKEMKHRPMMKKKMRMMRERIGDDD